MTNTNANYFPWEETKEDNVLPTMVGHFRVKSAEDGQSNNTGKRMPRVTFECVAPLELAGMMHFENYVVGSDEMPMAFVPGSMGTRNFKKLLKAAQVPPNNDVAVLLKSIEQSELLLSVVEYEEQQEGQYKGSKRNRISGYFRIGEREIGIAPSVGQGAGASAPIAPPAMPSMPQPTTPAAPAVTMPAAQPPGPPPQAPIQLPQPAAPTTPTAAPAPPAPPQPTALAPAAPPAPPATGGQMLRCGICQNDVPMADFGNHVQRHQSEPGWDGKSA